MRIYKDFPLSEILYYKIGGIAKCVLKIESKKDLLEDLEFGIKAFEKVAKELNVLAIGS